MKNVFSTFCLAFILFSCQNQSAEKNKNPQLFEFSDNLSPRWSSFENISATKGKGGKENRGAKGHPFDFIKAGEAKVLLEVKESGIINRIWLTINDRSPEMLRSLKIEFFWDGASNPAVSAPLGDFFGIGLGRMVAFENELFANPEGRSFNCTIPMPFKKDAKIILTNESKKDLTMLFFDVNFQVLKTWDEDYLYFHAFWHRDTATTLGKDFEILPSIKGKGRFLGTNIGVNANKVYKNYWFGEGEVKVYLDGDKDLPTLAGTGTEDYIGTAWGQGAFQHRYTGCLVADTSQQQWAFYRYHIPDPIFFQTDCKVTIQQIGGSMKKDVIALLKKGVKLLPITINKEYGLELLYEKDGVDLNNPQLPDGWVNFYRSDDVSATAYFYLDKPGNDFKLQDVKLRTYKLNP